MRTGSSCAAATAAQAGRRPRRSTRSSSRPARRQVPAALKSQLADGGRLVLPIGADAALAAPGLHHAPRCDPLRPGDAVRGALRAADRRAGLARPRGLRTAGRLTRRAPEERKSSRAAPSGSATTIRDRPCGPATNERDDTMHATRRIVGRRAFSAAALALALTPFTGMAVAQDKWPSKPINYIVPFPAGGTTDVLARLIGQKLGAGARHDDRRRQQGRRRRQRRLRDGVARRARRLHDPRRHDQLARDQRQPVPEDRLRPDRVVRADHADRHQPDRPRRQRRRARTRRCRT